MTKINYPFEEMKFQVDSMKLAKKVMFDTNASSLQSIAAIMDANAIDRAVLSNSLKALVEPFEMIRREYSTDAISQLSKTLSMYTQPSKIISDMLKQNALSMTSIYKSLPAFEYANISKIIENTGFLNLSQMFKQFNTDTITDCLGKSLREFYSASEFLEQGRKFAKDMFPDDLSINEVEAIINDDVDEVTPLTDKHRKFLKIEFENGFKILKTAKSIDDFILMFDRLNALAGFLPSYEYQIALYSYVVQRIYSGIDDLSGAASVMIICYVVHILLRNFESYNKLLEILKDIKNHSPFV